VLGADEVGHEALLRFYVLPLRGSSLLDRALDGRPFLEGEEGRGNIGNPCELRNLGSEMWRSEFGERMFHRDTTWAGSQCRSLISAGSMRDSLTRGN